MDNDLDNMSREELISEIKRLRNGIRAHRDSTGHDLCWHHPELWNLFSALKGNHIGFNVRLKNTKKPTIGPRKCNFSYANLVGRTRSDICSAKDIFYSL